jgi:hypothetical protein
MLLLSVCSSSNKKEEVNDEAFFEKTGLEKVEEKMQQNSMEVIL